MPRRWR